MGTTEAMSALTRGDIYGWANAIDADERTVVPMPDGVEVPAHFNDHHYRDPSVMAVVTRTGSTLITIGPDGSCEVRPHAHESDARACYAALVSDVVRGARIMGFMVQMKNRLDAGETPFADVVIVPDDLSSLLE